MAYSQNNSALHKSQLKPIHPSDCLDITINLQPQLADQPWLPGMSVFSANGPPYGATRSNVQGHYMLSGCKVESQGPAKQNGCFDPAIVIEHLRKSGASEDTIRSVSSNPALLDYNGQLMLLEQQNRKRLTHCAPRSPATDERTRCYGRFQSPHQGGSALQDYNTQLMQLEQENQRRLAIAREEKASSTPDRIKQELRPNMSPEPKLAYERAESDHNNAKAMDEMKREATVHPTLPSLPALHMAAFQNNYCCPHNSSSPNRDDQGVSSQNGPSFQPWLSSPVALPDLDIHGQVVAPKKAPMAISGNLALQNYQMQLMLLEAQNKKRKMLQDAAKAKEDEELAAQRQAIIQRHQVNIEHWQSAQQKQAMNKTTKESSSHTSSDHYKFVPFRPRQMEAHVGQDLQFAAQASASGPPHPTTTSTTGHHESSAMHGLSGNTPRDRIVMDLPIRTSNRAVEKADADLDMDEWAKVERPQKRACSEESELFSNGSDLIDLDDEF